MAAKGYDRNSHLILHRTTPEEIKQGIPVITRGEGVYVFDREGKKYLDFVAGVTRPVHVGFGRKELAQAAYDQMCKLAYYTPGQYVTEPALQLAEVLAEITPPAITHFLLECDGSEAVEGAMKIAKHYHYFKGERQRYKVVSRKGAYHGVNGISLRALGLVLPMRHMMEPLAPGGVFAESPYCFRCPYEMSYPACDLKCARDVEKVIEFESPEQISAFIGEPIQQGFGAYAPPKEYWPIVREICDRHGILLIIDEVICGFGRTGKMFGVEHFGVQPDLMTMAKGLTSGYLPLGAAGCSAKVWEPIEMMMHLHTYGSHPVSCATAIKNIEILRNEGLIENSRKMGDYLLAGLKVLEKYKIVGEARGTGLWAAIDFTADKKTRAVLPAAHVNRIILRAREKGLIIKTMGHALEFAPPLVIQQDEIDKALKVIEACIQAEEKEINL